MKIKRNEPCPCGSGKKYKKCCVSVLQQISTDQENLRKTPAQQPRTCGACTACCQGWLTTNALGHDIYVGKPCPYLSASGCDIHLTRPEEPCRVFFCGWAEANSELPSWMQPNLSGVIVLSERVLWRDFPVDVLVSANNDPNQRILSWFQQRSIEKMLPFIYQQNGQWFGFGPQVFQVDIAAKLARGEPLWDGSLDKISTSEINLDTSHTTPAIRPPALD